MDFMNLNQSAPWRSRICVYRDADAVEPKIIVGFWQDDDAIGD